jgi:hypothetical protein
MQSVPRLYKEEELERVVASDMRYSFLKTLSISPCGGGIEYPHLSPVSRRRRRKWNPVPRGITGPPCSWGI